MGTAPYHTVADLYPDWQGFGTTREQTVPEEPEQSALGESVPMGSSAGRIFTRVDFWKVLGMLAVVGAFLIFLGWARD